MGTKKSAPSAVVRAEHHASPAKLTAPQKRLLDEALRHGEDLREEMESKTLEYGRWLLEKVFANDTAAAFDDKSQNPVWQELIRRSGGPTLALNRKLLYVALRVAAADKRINAQAWRGLDVGRKEILLPLHDDKRLVIAARHVSDLNLSQRKTREYVTGMMADMGKVRKSRMTSRVLVSRMKKLKVDLGGPTAARQLRALSHGMTPKERTEVKAGLKDLLELARELMDIIGRK